MPPDPPPATGLRVLCVDDNRDLADSEALLLQAVGLDARACYSGIGALAEAAAFRPGACLIDLDMPGMDGCELARRLRAGTDHPLVLVAVTAMSGDVYRARAAEAGFDLYLVKPVAPDQLLLAVRRPAATD